MSQDKAERRPREPRSQPNVTEDLEKKMMQVGQQVYHIEMKQNGDSRFIRVIEDPTSQRRTRIVIPMCTSVEVCKRITEMFRFANSYSPKNVSEKKNRGDKTVYAHTLSFTSNGGRVYYMDLIDANDALTLRLSYLFGRRRDTIHILAQALPNLVEIIEAFNKQYPSLSPTDDYPASQGRQRPRRFGERRFNGPRNNRDFQRPFRNRGSQQYNGTPTSNAEGSGSENRRANALKVVSDPAPVQITSNLKRFTVEIVEGVNTFFRITEAIGETRKSTLHVPVELCNQLHTIMSDMNKKYTQSQKAAAPPAATTTKA